ncbi:class I SAM-dependent methyltransferase [Halocola ammonii]
MQPKYNKIGKGYDRTRKADPYLTSKLIEHLRPQTGKLYLDIGCGTGNYTNELAKHGVDLIGIDPSEKMLNEARLRNKQVDWRIGTAEDTGLPDSFVDGIVASLTIHHWSDLKASFDELHRVLKPGGRIVIFTSTPVQMKGYWLNHYFPKMLEDSISQMPDLGLVENAMTSAGFKVSNTDKYFIRPDLEDKFLYCGKQNPELYFDEQIRKGISSFSSLANRNEVDRGLKNLRKDIVSGEIWKVIERFGNDFGDYLYAIAEKNS